MRLLVLIYLLTIFFNLLWFIVLLLLIVWQICILFCGFAICINQLKIRRVIERKKKGEEKRWRKCVSYF